MAGTSSGTPGESNRTPPFGGRFQREGTSLESESASDAEDSDTQYSSSEEEGSPSSLEVRSKRKRTHDVTKFDQRKFESAISRMIITDFLPFKFVEFPGFREFSVLIATPVESFREFFGALLKIPMGSPADSEGVPCLHEMGNERNWTYDELVALHQTLGMLALAKMIIIDELPFEFVGNKGFKEFISTFQPQFKIPDQIAIADDCMNMYTGSKEQLKSNLSLSKQMLSLTTQTWTTIHNENYLCVTAHGIDERWELAKMILSFRLIPDHKVDTMGEALEKCLKEWEITKICTITVPNANPENLASSYLIQNMSAWKGTTLLNGEHVHLSCCTHILNSIVSDGFKEMDCCIAKIRAACKYVRSLSARLACFKRCVDEANISYDQMIFLDEPTKWNSTYLMLVVAEKFEKAFNLLEFKDEFYVKSLAKKGGPPNADDWNRARVFIKVLKIFYEAALSFSGYMNVSSNSFLRMWVKIQNALRSWMESDDIGLQEMATNMKLKFDKYWDIDGNVNNLLFVAIFLDPRFKFKYLEFCFGRIFGPEKCKDMLKKLENFIKKLFSEYRSSYPPVIPDTCESTGLSSYVTYKTNVSNEDGGIMDMDEEYGITVKKMLDELERNELERYMKDQVEVNNDGFDILKWWKGKSTKYNVLAHMARDILAIPVSRVSVEDAFSMGDRVLDEERSCLDPTTVEALICTKSWLRKHGDSHKTFDVVQVEREMLEDSAEAEELLTDPTMLEALFCTNSWLSSDIRNNGD